MHFVLCIVRLDNFNQEKSPFIHNVVFFFVRNKIDVQYNMKIICTNMNSK